MLISLDHQPTKSVLGWLIKMMSDMKKKPKKEKSVILRV